MKKPTRKLVEATLTRLGKPESNRYLFDRLNNPLWLEPLHEHGFFKRPPAADRREEEGRLTVSFPDWPELRYLLRMVEFNTEAVAAIVLEIPETDNALVRDLILKIAVRLPREHCRRLVDRACSWLDDAITRSYYSESFTDLIVHLAEVGELDVCERLMKALFGPSSDSTRSAMDEWQYERNLNRCLPVLRARLGLKSLAIVRGFLLDAIKLGRGEPDEFSYIWRREIGVGNFQVKSLRDVLVDAVRDTALEFARGGDDGFTTVSDNLLIANSAMLKRINMYVASQVPPAAGRFIVATLFDMDLLDRPLYRAEYILLLRVGFPMLLPVQREQLLDLAVTDPLRALPEERRQALGPERRESLARLIERDRLLAFGDQLPARFVPRRDELVRQLGEPRQDRVMVSYGPTSPKSREQLGGMGLQELKDYLSAWKGESDVTLPSPEGLGRALQEVVKGRAPEFANAASLYVDLDPTYVRAVITGLSDAVGAQVTIGWPEVLKLASWVMAQPQEQVEGRQRLPEFADVGWSWTRQAIARLLENGLRYPQSGLPFESRYAVWSIIHGLTRDPDPQPGRDEPGEDEEPLTRAINSVRGVATQTLFRYSWWVHENTEKPADETQLTFDRMPEVREALERSLEDTYPAIHSILGEWLPTLAYFDRRWTTSHIDDLLPEDADHEGIWKATWSTLVEYGPVYGPFFAAFPSKYRFAVEKLRDASDEERRRMGERGLGQQLVVYFWNDVALDSARDILLSFFDACSPAITGNTAWFVGRNLHAAEGVPAAVLERLASLWIDLTTRSRNWEEKKRRELHRQFGRWFASGQFQMEWALDQLQASLAIGAGMLDLDDILQRLEEYTGPQSDRVVGILELLLRDERQLALTLSWPKGVEGVLKKLLRVGGAAALERTKTLIELLVEGGNLFARDLVRQDGWQTFR